MSNVRERYTGESYSYKLVCAGDEMGKRCEETELWCKKPWERTEMEVKMAGELKEDHIFREFENIVHVVGLRLKDVRVRCWRT